MKTLLHCPACRSTDLSPVNLRTDLTELHVAQFGEGVIIDADYAACRLCELLFARRRQCRKDAEPYYDAFRVLESRDYAVFPPPQDFLAAQRKFSQRLLSLLAGEGLLTRGQRVLCVRCECGEILHSLREDHGIADVYGLDHFESNVQYARTALSLENVALLHPIDLRLPFEDGRFDLILANHQITHAIEPLEMLHQLRGRLSDRGVLVLYNEQDHTPIFRSASVHRRGINNYHKQLLSDHSLTNLCRLAGLEPTLLARDPDGIRWASGRHSMVFIARPADPLDAGSLTPRSSLPLLASIKKGRRKQSRKDWIRTIFSLRRRDEDKAA